MAGHWRLYLIYRVLFIFGFWQLEKWKTGVAAWKHSLYSYWEAQVRYEKAISVLKAHADYLMQHSVHPAASVRLQLWLGGRWHPWGCSSLGLAHDTINMPNEFLIVYKLTSHFVAIW